MIAAALRYRTRLIEYSHDFYSCLFLQAAFLFCGIMICFVDYSLMRYLLFLDFLRKQVCPCVNFFLKKQEFYSIKAYNIHCEFGLCIFMMHKSHIKPSPAQERGNQVFGVNVVFSLLN